MDRPAVQDLRWTGDPPAGRGKESSATGSGCARRVHGRGRTAISTEAHARGAIAAGEPVLDEPAPRRLADEPIAIVGMAAIMPMAADLASFWDNIVGGRDCITDVPASRWSLADYYDPDPSAPDKTYCRRGGFMPEVEFDPIEFGIPPNSLEVTDVAQLLALVVAKRALEDAGHAEMASALRDRTGVILGVGGGQKLLTPLTARLQYPVWERVLAAAGVPGAERAEIVEAIKAAYVPWEESSFPGMLGNVIAGRITNRLDLGGTNCVVDAACASSFAALKMAVSELAERRCDMVITGGVDTDNTPLMYLCFSKTPAFTPGDRIRPFDAGSDGMMIGEGLGMCVLRRLADARAAGDRVYAVIRGIGTSSDGRFKSIYAPRSDGQALALERAYLDARCAPTTVGLVEAHGTGTVAGDIAEVETLHRVFAGAPPGRVALGSVKSQIGHTKSAAGAAGLIKAAMALHAKVVPPTINVERPNPRLGLGGGSPFYLQTSAKPWIAPAGSPRRAAVSSFGFGGTNYHVVLEEDGHEHAGAYRTTPLPASVVVSAEDPAALARHCRETAESLESGDAAEAFAALGAAPSPPSAAARVGLVAGGPADAAEALRRAAGLLEERPDAEEWQDPRGLVFRRRGLELSGRTAAVFPGQGSQYVNMGRELAIAFPGIREAFAAADAAASGEGGGAPLSSVVFPPSAFEPDDAALQEDALRRTERAQPAIGAMSAGIFAVMRAAGFAPDFAVGHSFGELTALWAAGAIDDADYARLTVARGRAMAPADGEADPGTMLAVAEGADPVAARLAAAGPAASHVVLANVNAPRQTVLAGPRDAVAAAGTALAAAGMEVTPLPVAAAFHSPLVAHARPLLAEALATAAFRAPRVPVYANATAEPYAPEPAAIRALLLEQVTSPVRFRDCIERLYEAGARCFVEIGPSRVLTGLIRQTLGDRPAVVVAVDSARGRNGVRQLQQAMTELRVAGLELGPVDRHQLPPPPAPRERSAATVLLNGANYVSPQTRARFDAALASLPATAGTAPPRLGAAEAAPEPVAIGSADPASAPAVPAPSPVAPPVLHLTAEEAPMTTPATDADGNPVAAFAEQQRQCAASHERYLAHQIEYAGHLASLASQLAAIARPDVPPPAVEAFGRSLELLHEHQTETSRVHGEYLSQQAAFAEIFARIAGNEPAARPAGAPAPPAPGPASIPPPPPPPPRIAASSTNGAGEPTQPVAAAPPPPPAPASAASEPFAAPPAVAPAEPVAAAPASPVPPSAEGPDPGEALIAIVADKTGYPAEVLDLGMEIEGDLGIDSIKRVEILGALREIYPELPTLTPAEIAELSTLGHVIEYIREAVGAGSAAPAPVARPPEGSGNGAGAGIEVAGVRLGRLPEPDRLEVAPPPGHVCLVTDDGTPATDLLVEALRRRGWAAAVPLRLPAAGPDAAGDPAAEEDIVAALVDEAERRHGPIGGLVHLHPDPRGAEPPPADAERSILRQVYLIARRLDASLPAAGRHGRAPFVTVVRLDGAFGLDGDPSSSPLAGGLSGLVKTLAHEWPEVFCRALDIHPAFSSEAVVERILAELGDPDRATVEVAHSADGRRQQPVLDGVERV
jgi:polyketide-type polyunsaturated fatty acid synthase PfaA